VAVRVNERSVDGIAGIEIDNETLRALVVPELGANIRSLVDLRTGREWLAQSPRRLRLRTYSGRYDEFDYSGWDECFPGIGACYYPDPPWQGVAVADHGEVWTLPWQTDLTGSVLTQSVHGVRFPYTFERTVDFAGPKADSGGLALSYVVTNHSPFQLKAFWSAHPMLAVTPTTRFLIPDHLDVRVEVSKHGWLGQYLTRHPWPFTRDHEGNPVDLSVVGPASQDHVDKLFSTRLREGWGAVFDEQSEDFLALTFSPDLIPFVGVCGIRGEWPTAGDSTLVGLIEPCSGWPDRLDVAIDRGEHVTLPPQSRLTWELDLTIGRGRADLDAVIQAAPRAALDTSPRQTLPVGVDGR
jgi:hypothetical protein